ncbi:MAG: ABC transporter ATP-binding protein [Beijerinckiaceae bacterium]|jgi:peptide/nickel transport system ATP-binding protein|nr:ABC transporter ATP-binding protein [Beijerinckiaceae bacterium]
MAPLIEIRDLRVEARGDDGQPVEIVKGVSFTVERGEVMGLIGESGSGKTTIALALMGYARFGCRISGGTVRIGDTEVTGLSEAALRKLRGRRVAYIAQSAAASFNPSRTIMQQVIEAARIHGTLDEAAAREKAIGLFRAMAIPKAETIGERYPHQVSGGQLQRLMAAMALITDPEVVIFDEPTTALDVTTQIEVLKAFKSAIRDRNTTGIYVTHDLAVIAQIADSITVLRHGFVQETAKTGMLLASPAQEYTRNLLAAAEPARRERPALVETAAPLLKVTGLTVGYGGLDAEGMPLVPVVREVDLAIRQGEALGVIGESGCGKSTLARAISGLAPPARGTVELGGKVLGPGLAQRSREELREIQLVFQSADTALNPRVSIGEIIGRPLTFFFGLKGAERDRRVRELLDLTHLPASVLNRQPGDLSGGQKQRVNLARALAAKPRLLLCDEVTSALDTLVAAAILDLLAELRKELGLTTMFISHDLKTIRAICDQVLVLYAGRVVETLPASAISARGHHPYAKLLFSSVPALHQGWLDGLAAPAMPASATEAQGREGCTFFHRCELRMEGTCDRIVPPPRQTPEGLTVACHHPLEG